MTKRRIILNGIVSLLLLASTFSAAFFLKEQPIKVIEPVVLDVATQKTYKTLLEVTQMIDDQAQIDADILAEFEAGDFTLNDPLIIINPYKIAPLTALVLFKTDQPVSISIHVEGKSEEVGVDHTISETKTTHILPIYGLYAGTNNTVTLTATDAQNNESTKTAEIQTEALMPELASNNFLITQSGLPMSPGFTFSYRNSASMTNKTAFDQFGDYRWILSKNYHVACNFNQGKSLVVGLGDELGNMFFLELSYLGKVLTTYYSPYGNHHDLEITETELLVTGSSNMPNTIEDFIFAIDLKTGTITKTLSYLKMLDRTRNAGVIYSNYDWLHMNSITPYQNDVIISSNYQSSIIRNDWNGQIQWILADPIDYSTKYRPYLLKPIGSDFLYPYNQHAVEVLPDTDHNPDTLDILVFDNGTSRFLIDEDLQRQIDANEIVAPKRFSRMVQYQINEKTMTVRQIWSYGEDRPELFASTRGDHDLLANGNYLGVFFSNITNNGVTTQRSAYVEIDSNQKIVWEAIATGSNVQNSYVEYRAERFEIYNSSSIESHLGQSVSNFIPQDLLQKAAEYGLSLIP